MKCYYCGQNEADHRFLVNYMGTSGEVHLCKACVEMFARQAGAVYREYRRQNAAGAEAWEPFFLPQEAPAQTETNPFPDDAGKEIRCRRGLNVLRAQLEEAVRAERYEQAARLRDQIAGLEKGVCLYDT